MVMEFVGEMRVMMEMEVIKGVEKKEGVMVDEFRDVKGSVLLFVDERGGGKVVSVGCDGFGVGG